MQVSYETFGCNDGNVFFIGIDDGNTNDAVIEFDSIYGVQYPGVSGQQGGGGDVHLQYNILGVPTIVVITPDKLIANQQISPPSTENMVAAITNAGGIQQSCLTSIDLPEKNDFLTISPNPVRNIASISINLQESKNLEIDIYNSTGQKIIYFSPAFYNSGYHNVEADFSGQAGGLYIVMIKENNEVLSRKKLILME